MPSNSSTWTSAYGSANRSQRPLKSVEFGRGATHHLDVLIVAYRPDFSLLERLLASLVAQVKSPFDLRVSIFDNSCNATMLARLKSIAKFHEHRLGAIQVLSSDRNLGFGSAINRLLRVTEAPQFLVVNPDAWFAPDALAEVARQALDDPQAAAWELRQAPYEQPKEYDPVTLATPWVSGAACVLRRRAVIELGGFDEGIFLYGEDVDLSWRLRCNGWTLRYVPRAVVVHHSYRYANEVKSAQVFGGAMASLCLRARFGTWHDIATGCGMLAREIMAPSSFPGRRFGLARNLFAFFLKLRRFRSGGWNRRAGFRPTFIGWNFAQHRDGDFHEMMAPPNWSEPPLVSILIRTHQRTNWLREALQSVANQTYPNIETIVVEDGPPLSRHLVESEFTGKLNLRYVATGEHVGRARAGNFALAEAKGEWLNFLDDDDLLFADHVEVLVSEAQRRGLAGIYALAWETPTRVLCQDPLLYEEIGIFTRYREDFDRIALWHHHYIPIQAAMFHRSLYEECGGFSEDMDQLEDWNLWTRFTLRHDFGLVRKTTSKYRVPADGEAATARLLTLGKAYAEAVARQRDMVFEATPPVVAQWIDLHSARERGVVAIPSPVANLRQIADRYWVTRALVRMLRPLVRRFRRLRAAP